MTRRLALLLSLLAGCADSAQPTDPTQVCADASAVFATCGMSTDESPFGTCQADQRDAAEQVMAIYDDQGCAGLTNAKADGFACTSLPFLCVEHSVSELAAFTTDGCSMFPDGTLLHPTRWQQCCIEHDYAYYAGGPEALRLAADEKLRTCISAQTSPTIGDIVYYAVRVGGSPVFPTPWRWGYGWKYDVLNGYRSLPSEQASAANASIAAYQAHPVAPLAIEQRLRTLADVILLVPRLTLAIEEFTTAIRMLD